MNRYRYFRLLVQQLTVLLLISCGGQDNDSSQLNSTPDNSLDSGQSATQSTIQSVSQLEKSDTQVPHLFKGGLPVARRSVLNGESSEVKAASTGIFEEASNNNVTVGVFKLLDNDFDTTTEAFTYKGNLTLQLSDISDPDGIHAVYLSFSDSDTTLAVCNNSGSQPCPDGTFSQVVTGLSPYQFGLNANQALTLEVWVQDKVEGLSSTPGKVQAAAAIPFNWQSQTVDGLSLQWLNNETQIQVNWNQSSDFIRYNVYLAKEPITDHKSVLSLAGGQQDLAVDGNSTTFNVTDDSGYYVLVTGIDGSGESGFSSLITLALPQNDPPTVPTLSLSTQEDTALLANVLEGATDPDQDTLKVKSPTVFSAEGVQVNILETGEFTYTPKPNVFGITDSFSFIVTDSKGHDVTSKVNIFVSPVNDAPQANPETLQIVAQQAGVFVVPAPGLLNNDSDIEGDSLTVNTTLVSAPSAGTVVVAENGGFAVTLNNADLLQPEISFVYAVEDSAGGRSEATATVLINPSSPTIQLASDSYAIDEDTVLQTSVSIFDNDQIPNLNEVSVSLVTTPLNGVITAFDNVTGQFTYTPAVDFAGTDFFVYQVDQIIDDNTAIISRAVVLITVNQINDAPNLTDDGFTATLVNDVSRIYEIAAPGVLANDFDVETERSQFQSVLVTTTSNGFLELKSDGGFIYSPNVGFVGVDTFTYEVADEQGLKSSATVSITVTNDGVPIANPDTISASEGFVALLTPLDNDIGGAELRITQPTSVIGLEEAFVEIINNGQALSFTPPENFDGVATISYSITDESGIVVADTYTVTMVPEDDAPVISGTPPTTVAEGDSYSFKPFASDPDFGDTLTFSIENKPSWALFDTTTGELKAELVGFEDAGVYSGIVITVTDSSDAKLSASLPAFSIEVTNTNNNPFISGTPLAGINEDNFYQFIPQATDIDSNTVLTFSIVGKPDWAEFNSQTGELSGIPSNASVGQFDNIQISVSDGEASVSLPAFTLSVFNVNDAPTIVADGLVTSVNEDSLYDFTPTANDVDLGDSLTFAADNLPSWLTFDSSSGRISGIPTNEDVGTYTNIKLSVMDSSDTQVSLDAFSITVINTNDTPNISGLPSAVVNEDSVYQFIPQVSDVDVGDSFTFSIFNKPVWADFNEATGELKGTPENQHVGNYSDIQIEVIDSGNAKAILNAFAIEVINVNDAPVITAIPQTSVSQDSPYFYALNAIDDDANTVLTYSVGTLPSWLTFDADKGQITGTPTNDDTGKHPIQLFVSDGIVTVEKSFELSVDNVNDAPVVVSSQVTSVNEDEVYAYPFVATDPDGDPITVTIEQLPTWLNHDVTTNVISGTPSNDEVGDHQIQIKVSDGVLSVTESFVVTVNNVNDLPVVELPTSVTAVEDTSYDVDIKTSDVDLGDSVTLSFPVLPTWLTFDSINNKLLGTPTNADVGVHPLTVKAQDSVGFVEHHVEITVVNTNDAPTIDSAAITSTNEDAPYFYTIFASDVDVGDVLTYSAQSLPSWLVFDATTRTLSGTPTNKDVGKTSIHLAVSDGTITVDQIFDLDVVNVNDAPLAASDPSLTANEDTPLVIALDAYVSDVDVGDSFTITSAAAINGSVTIEGSALTYTPITDFSGADSVAYMIQDSAGAVASASIAITVVAGNDDGDNFDNAHDNCIAVANNDQLDTDGDGAGDACDSDDDNDGVEDGLDAFPLDPAETNDFDKDGIGDNADTDDDNDGVPDSEDAFPFDETQSVTFNPAGGGVKGPMAFATVNLYQIDYAAEDYKSTLITTAETDSTAAIVGLNFTDQFSPPYLLEIVDDADTIDITTNLEPVITAVSNIITQDMIDSGDKLYATPLSSMAATLALYKSSNDEELATNLAAAEQQVKSTMGFGADKNIDIFSTPPILNNATDSASKQVNTTQYRTAVEAFTAVIYQMLALSSDDNVTSTQIIQAMAKDLSDGAIDGQINGVAVTEYNNNALEIIEQDPSTLVVPNAFDDNGDPLTVAGVKALVIAEQSKTGQTGLDTTTLASDETVIAVKVAETNPDRDGDGVYNSNDAFPDDASGDSDFDGDGIPDIAYELDALGVRTGSENTAKSDPDDDNDGVDDDIDAFPYDPSEVMDTDGDKIGNNADTDDDGDGVIDSEDDFPLDKTRSNKSDQDNDGWPNGQDPDDNDNTNPGTLFIDTDKDGVGDTTDTDDDNDGVEDANDKFPLDATETKDFDGDNIGDNADPDDDNDGVNDVDDAFPFDDTESADFDGDGIGDNADLNDDNDGLTDLEEAELGTNPKDIDSDDDGVIDGTDAVPLDPTEKFDSDNDGIGNESDNCPVDSNTTQANNDGDALGDICDPDDDNDGVLDVDDAFPFDSSLSGVTDADGDGWPAGQDADDNDKSVPGIDFVDTDGDGIADINDLDNDNDGIADTSDTDIGNDGILDSLALTAYEDVASTFSLLSNQEAVTLSELGAGNGVVSINDNQTIAYQPNSNFNGTDTLSFSFTSSLGVKTSTSTSISVFAVNDVPVITSTQVTSASEDSPYTYTFVVTDIDTNDSLTLSAPTLPSWLNFNVATGELTGTPTNDEVGSHTVKLRVNDGTVDVEQDFSITVANVNDAPVITSSEVTTVNEDVAYSYIFTASDVDTTDSLTLSAPTLPSWLNFNAATGELSGTPTNDEVGSHTVKLRVNDGTVDVEQDFNITVANVNDAPVITSSEVTSVNEDVAYSYTFTASDVDTTDSLTLSAPTLPSWLNFNSATGELSGTPTNDEVGSHTVKLRVNDGTVDVEQDFNITVANVNDAPVITSSEVTAVNEDVAYSYTFVATDVDTTDSLTLSAPTLPSWLNFNSATGELSGTPTNDEVGSHTVKLRVNDGTVDVEQDFSITVANVNDAPVITSSEVTSVNEDVAYSYIFTASDVDTTDSLTLSAPTLPSWLNFNVATGELSGTPTNDEVGSHTVTLRVNDGTVDVEQDFSITVANVNDAPVITSSEVTSVNEDVAYSYIFTASDVDTTDSLTLSAPTLPSWLNFNVATGELSGTPTNDEVGSHTVTLRVNDGTVDVEQDFNITVANVNDAPVITSTQVTDINEDVEYSYTFVATDVDTTDSLILSAPTLPSWLNFNVATGELSGTPTNDEVGSHTVKLRVNDGTVDVEQDFSITVANVNDAPVITSSEVTSVNEDVAYSYTFTASDVDTTDSLMLSAPTLPSWLNFNVATGELTGTPTNDEVGSHTVKLRVNDGTVDIDQDFSITVANVNDAPVITSSEVTSVNEDVAYSYIFTASDVDTTDSLTLSAPTLPSWLNFNAATGELSGTPTNDEVGSHTVKLRVNDGTVDIDQDFSITVANVNDAPVITSSEVTSVNEDVAYSYTFVATDVDTTDSLTLSAPTLPSWLNFNSATGELSGTPTNDEVGSHTVKLRVNDGTVDVEQDFSITVANVNDAPVITSSEVTSVNEDVAYSYIFTASDVDTTDSLTLSAPTLPSWLNFNVATGELSGTPTNDEVGSHTVTLRVNDGTVDVEQDFSITVANVNDAPVITSSEVTSVNEDVAYSYIFTASDVDTTDSLTLSAPTLPSWLNFNVATGELSGTPTNDEVGSHTVTLRVNDGTVDIDQDFSITVANVNDAPVITSSEVTSVNEDVAYSYTFVATDVDTTDSLTLSAPTLPSWLNFNSATGELSGTPTNDEVGSHTVKLRVNDGTVDIDQDFSITVANVNDAPVITSSEVTSVNEDVAYSYTFVATDVDTTDSLTLSAPTLPSWLNFNSATGELSGTPTNDEVGSHTVKLRVNDGTVDIDQDFSITVANVNDAPVITSSEVTSVNEDVAYSYTFVATDVDTTDSLTLSAPTLPSWLNFNSATGELSGTPTNDEVGSHTVKLRVNDGTVDIDQDFSITVANVNDAPVITSSEVTVVNEDVAYSYTFTASDVDTTDSLTLSAPTLPSWLNFNVATGELSGTPTNDEVGSHTVKLRVNDGTVDVEQDFSITVANVNDAPVITSSEVTSVNEDVAYSYTFIATDVDTTDSLILSAPTLPSWLNFNVATGELSGTPTNDEVGSHTVKLRVNDGTVDIDQDFSITVANVNDAPVITSSEVTSVNEDVAYSYTFVATDVDTTDSLTLSAPTLPSWLNFNAATGELSGTPTNDEVGSHTVKLRVNDGTVDIDQDFSITVANVNDAPVITSSEVTSVNEDVAYSYTFTASDVDTTDSLTLSAPTLPSWLNFNSATGELSGTPTNDEVGSHTVKLRVNDGTVDVEQDFNITVANVNDAPVITSSEVTAVNEDVAYSYTFVATDVDTTDSLTLSAPTLPSWLNFNVATGELSGTPTNDEVGSHTVKLRVNDGTVDIDQDFSITVANVNDAPVITSTQVTDINEDAAYSYTFVATDVDTTDSLTLSAPTLPSWLNFNAATGELSGTPTNDEVGSHTVKLRVNDGTVDIDQDFSITVANVNDAPVITSSEVTAVNEDVAYSYTFVATDVDTTDSLTLSAPTLPSWLNFNAATGELSGTPTNDEVGSHTVKLRVNDGTVDIDQDFSITVANVNDAPVITSSEVTSVNEDVAYSYTFVATDVDTTDSLTLSAPTLPSWLNFNSATGELSGTPTNDEVGSHTVKLRVNDGTVDVEQDFSITVANVNDAPTDLFISANTVAENLDSRTAILVGELSSTDPDVGDTAAYSITGGSDSASFTISGSNLQIAQGVSLDFESQSSYAVEVTVTDSDSATYAETLTISLTDVNDAPTDIAISASSIAENTSTASAVTVGSLTSTDQDSGDTAAYSITGGSDSASFTISGSNLQIAQGVSLDFESQSSYAVEVTVTDSDSATYAETLTISLTDVNDAPTDIAISASSIAENTSTASAVTVGSLTSTDQDSGDTVAYSITGGADSASFTISGSNLQIAQGVSLDFESQSSYAVEVTVTDSDSATYAETLTISLTDVNDAPTDIAISASSIAENTSTASAVTVGSLTSTDQDSSDTAAYSITGGSDSASFTISGSNLQIAQGVSLDFESQSSYAVEVTVTDSDSATYAETLTISLTDVNDAPTDIAISASSIAENTSTASAVTVGSLTSTDQDSGDTAAYSITGGSDSASFTISGSNLQIAQGVSLDFESQSSYAVEVTVTDSDSATYAETLTISLTDVNDAPTDIAISASSIAENTSTASAVTVGSLTSTDQDSGDTAAYSITGGSDSASFTISGSNLQIAQGVSLDFESQSSYAVEVTVTDSDSATYAETLTISLTDVNDAPTDIAISASSIAENTSTASAVTVGSLTSTDQDSGDTAAYSITGGSDSASFTISGSNLQIAQGVSLDFESQSSYAVEVTVTDSDSATYAETLTISLTDVNDAPTDIAISASSIAENTSTASAVTVGSLISTDQDSGDTAAYSITGGSDSASFTISGSNLQIAQGVSLDFESQSSYAVEVTVTDSDSATYAETLTISLTDVNDAPTDIAISASSIAENTSTASAVTVGSLTSTDQDSGDTAAYSITGGSDSASFTISGSNLQIAQGVSLDFESQSSYAVEVTVTDSDSATYAETLTISLTDVNDAPTDIAISASSIAENTDTSSAVTIGTLTGTDEDSLELFSYSISGTDAATFSLGGDQNDELQIVASTVIDYEAKSSYDITITITDKESLTFDKDFTINVTNVAPAIKVDDVDTVITAVTLDEDGSPTAFELSGLTADENDGGNGSELTWSQATAPSNGSLSISGSGSSPSEFTYTPTLNYNGSDSFQIQVTDGVNTDTLLVNLTIDPINDNPQFDSVELTSINEDAVYTYNITYSDVDGDGVSLVGSTIPSWLTLTNVDNQAGTATLTGTPINSEVGNHSVLLDLSDDADPNGSAQQSFSVAVANTNDAPVLTGDSFTIPESVANGYVVGSVTVADDDSIHGETFSYAITAGDSNNAFAIDSAGQITVADKSKIDYETATSFALTVQVTDSGAATDTDPVNLTILDAVEVYNLALDTNYGDSGHSKFSSHLSTLKSEFVAIKAQSDGKLIALGAGSAELSENEVVVVRFTADGVIDRSFGDNGFSQFDMLPLELKAQDFAIFNDDIYVLANTYSVNEQPVLLKFNGTTGALDTSFGSSGIGGYDYGNNVYARKILLRDNDDNGTLDEILLAAESENGGYKDFALISLEADGTYDVENSYISEYTPSGDSASLNHNVTFMVEQANGQILIGGYAQNVSSLSVGRIIRYNAIGTHDTTYGNSASQTCSGATYEAGTAIFCISGDTEAAFNDAVLYNNGTEDQLIVAGYTENNSVHKPLIAQFTNAGVLETGYNSTGYRVIYDDSNPAEATMVTVIGTEVFANYEAVADSAADFIMLKTPIDGSSVQIANAEEISDSDSVNYPMADRINSVYVDSSNNLIVVGSAHEDQDQDGNSERQVAAIASFDSSKVSFVSDALETTFAVNFADDSNGFRRVGLSTAVEHFLYWDNFGFQDYAHLDGSNNLYILGDGADGNEGTSVAINKLDTTGSLTDTFGFNGQTVPILDRSTQNPVEIAVSSDGIQYLLVEESGANLAIHKYDANGDLDATFNKDVSASEGAYSGSDLTLDNSGNVVFVGIDGAISDLVVKSFTPAGASLLDVSIDFSDYADPLINVEVDSSGNIIVAYIEDYDYKLRIARITSTGSLDTTWGDSDGQGGYTGILTVNVDANGQEGDDSFDSPSAMTITDDDSIIFVGLDNSTPVVVGVNSDGSLISTGNWSAGVLELAITADENDFEVLQDVKEINGQLVIAGSLLTFTQQETTLGDGFITMVDITSGTIPAGAFAGAGYVSQDLVEDELVHNLVVDYELGQISAWISTVIKGSTDDKEFLVASKYNSTTSFAPVVLEGQTVVNTYSEDAAAQVINLTAYDGDGDSITWSISTDASNGTAVLVDSDTSATLTYTPSANFNGSDTVVLTVSDGTNKDTVTLNFTIDAVNDLPVISEGTTLSQDLEQDTSFQLTLNATDVDSSDVLTWSITTDANNGSASLSDSTGNDAVLDYTPTASFFGDDSVVVTVSDGNGGTDAITIDIDVLEFNNPPTANDADYTIYEAAPNGTVIGTYSATDIDLNIVTYSITAGNDDGIFALNSSTGELTVADGSQLDYETLDSYSLTIGATDNAIISKVTSATITIGVDDITEKDTPSIATDFGDNGEQRVEVYGGNVEDELMTSNIATLQADGKLLVVTRQDSTNAVITRHNTDGSIDYSFADQGTKVIAMGQMGAITPTAIVAAIDDSDSSTEYIYVVGYGFINYSTEYESFIAKYDLDGNLVTAFDTDGYRTYVSIDAGVNDYAQAIFVQDDYIYLAGYGRDSDHDGYVARFDDTTGLLDTLGGFGTGGQVDFATGTTSLTKMDLHVIQNGSHAGDVVVSYNTGYLFRYDVSATATQTTFTADEKPYAIAEQSDGTIVTVGQSNGAGYVLSYSVDGGSGLFVTSGSAITISNSGFSSQSEGQTAISSYLNDVTINGSDNVYVAGAVTFSSYTANLIGYSTSAIAWDTSLAGDADNRGYITQTGVGNFDEGKTVILDGNDELFVVGTSKDASDNQDVGLVKLQSDASLQSSFAGSGQVAVNYGSESDYVAAAKVTTGNDIFFVSDYRFDSSDYDVATTKVLSSGDIASDVGVIGHIKDGYSANSYDYALDVHYLSDNSVLVLSVAEDANVVLSKFNLDGSLDSNFGTGGQVVFAPGSNTLGSPGTIAVDSTNNIYISVYDGEISDSYLVAYDSAGNGRNIFSSNTVNSLDLAINSSAPEIYDMSVDANDDLFVAGKLSGDGFIAKINPSADGVESSWGTNGYVTVDGVGFSGDVFYEFVFDSSSNIYLVGKLDISDFVFGALTKVTADGSSVNTITFAEDGAGTDVALGGENGSAKLKGIYIANNQQIYITGEVDNDLLLARVLKETLSIDTTFNSTGYVRKSATGSYGMLAVREDGNLGIRVAGSYTESSSTDLLASKYNISREYHPHIIEGASDPTTVVWSSADSGVWNLTADDVDGDKSNLIWTVSDTCDSSISTSLTQGVGSSTSLNVSYDGLSGGSCAVTVTVTDGQSLTDTYIVNFSNTGGQS
ncbi:hypothetical protein C2869_11365 [Saccharobesus litoralis]|uniref:Cadherin domain-containing protein n=1 Tax=Saccharobesus litoralis TaxID=2172099 RepID=A0A2S0VS06_9ALTE|nr:putative Ig domain-containing protein [Saccharobesus litoralis]AWB66998.1 hypothetical protein C2869_11365 [Saccharobesus litoralis]